MEAGGEVSGDGSHVDASACRTHCHFVGSNIAGNGVEKGDGFDRLGVIGDLGPEENILSPDSYFNWRVVDDRSFVLGVKCLCEKEGE